MKPRRQAKVPFARTREIYTPGKYPCSHMLHDCDEQQASLDDKCVNCGFTSHEHRVRWRAETVRPRE